MHNDFVKRDLEQDEEEDQESEDEDERDSFSSKGDGSEEGSEELEVDLVHRWPDEGGEIEDKEGLEKEDSDDKQGAEETVEDTISTGLKSVRIDDSVKVLDFHSLPFCSIPCKG